MSPRLVLIGPPGAGKSSVAQLVAGRLGLSARDTDTDVETVAGCTVAEIFIDHGEARFRELERRAVADALTTHDGVLALGGGAVMDQQTQAELRTQTVVFLDVGLPDASRRIGFNASRPLLVGNPRAQWLRLMEARRPVYEGAATVTVMTDGKSPEQVADDVLDAIATLP